MIKNVNDFRYLGRVLDCTDQDDKAVAYNRKKVQEWWGHMVRILTGDGVRSRSLAHFYITIVQAILLHGSETWVLSQRSCHQLDMFHHHCARYIMHDHICKLPNGDWYIPHSEDMLARCGLSQISTYCILPNAKLNFCIIMLSHTVLPMDNVQYDISSCS